MGRVTGRGKTTCENCPQIDVARWNRAGQLRHGATFTTSWTGTGGWSLFLAVQVEPTTLLLTHSPCADGDSPQPVVQTVPLDFTPCRYGGSRTWFRCPVCHHRAGKLYFAGRPGRFACRQCHNLTYAAQVEGPQYRGLRRANRLRLRLGGQPGMDFPIPDRPPHMHRTTYIGMVNAIRELEARAEQRAAALLAPHACPATITPGRNRGSEGGRSGRTR